MKNSDIYKALLGGMDEETKKLLESGAYPAFNMKDWAGYRFEVDQDGKWRLVKVEQ